MAAGGGMLGDGSGLPGLGFCLCSWLWCDILHRLHAGRGWSLLFWFCAVVCPRSGGASRLFNPKEEEEEAAVLRTNNNRECGKQQPEQATPRHARYPQHKAPLC